MAVLTEPAAPRVMPSRALTVGFMVLALLAAGSLGVAAGLGVSSTFLIAGVVGPFILLLTLARPHWAVTIYAVLVYADLLSVLTRFHDLPPVARFAGAIVLTSALGYRLIIRRTPLANDEMTWWLILYGIVVALGLGYARDADAVQRNLIEFVRNLITYLVIINTVNKPNQIRRILWALVGMGVLLALLTIFQSITGQFDNDFGGLAQYRVSEIAGGNDAARPSGTLGDANYYGQSLLILLPLALYLIFEGRNVLVRLLGTFAAACLIMAIVYTYSRGDALAVMGILALAALYKKLHPTYLIGALVALVLILPLLPPSYVDRLTTVVQTAQGNQQTILNEASIRGRAGANQAAIAMFLDHPILGVGRENYPLYQLDYLSGTSLAFQAKGIPPHDLYLEIAAEHGLIGLLVMAGLLLTAGRALLEARRRFLAVGDRPQAELASWLGIGLFGYLISSLFLHGAYLYMLWLQLALIIALRQIARAALPTPAPSERS
jgi:O-antigen ligase